MAQFEVLNKNVEVNREAVMSVVNSMEKNKECRKEILMNNGIDIQNKEWVNQQKWLDAFEEITESLGDMNVFLIGKAIIKNAKFPPIKDLEDGLKAIDVAYHMNHRLHGKIMFDPASGKKLKGIGNYNLVEFNEKERMAVMVCDNPYPSKFDEGIITQIVRKFKPPGSRENVTLDESKTNRTMGGDSCNYLINW